MKVAFDSYPMASPALSGVGTHALRIAYEVYKSGQADCEFLLYDFLRRRKSADLLRERIGNIDIHQNNILPYGIFAEIWDYIPVSYNSLFRSDADIMHFFNFVVPPKTKGKIINTVHDLVFYTYPETMKKSNYRRMTKNVCRSCDMSDIIVAVSQNGKRELMKIMNIPEEKIRVVYNGVDHDRFRPDISEPNLPHMPEDYVLYIGTLEPRKNLKTLLKAFSLTKASKDGCKLVIAGSKGWEYEEIFSMAKSLDIDVVFTGYVPSEKLPPLYKGAKAFAFPSLYEGFGIPPLEAMACGTPVVSSNSSSLPEVVGDAGLMISDPYDTEELAHHLDRVIYDSETAKTCRERGFVQSQRFTWKKSGQTVLNIYKELTL